ncbi:hypothetical protein [Mycolicibacterium fortuitum]|uniref:hypothetical protein n=1 Tax=Mycolicibacterium fortuitum TaxID=1766 RepID=UPI0022BA494F|nr:hypothetical protein [Mycolicibacterium fortuitum]MDG5773909.1 hypothetical protein [Mycolicibacterium fortuitum]MDG5779706.1 hypothetical protein [Mycolicibacterium fortuitum]WAY18438.1 hypothetical protein OF855_24690 [Mycolicibacterium fortuitum]
MSDVVQRAKAVLEGITDGPWIAEYSGEQGNCVIPHDAQSTREAVATTHLYHQLADAEFIAQARTLVPELVAEVERLRSYKSLPPGWVWQDYYSPDDVCKIRAEYEAEIEQLKAREGKVAEASYRTGQRDAEVGQFDEEVTR